VLEVEAVDDVIVELVVVVEEDDVVEVEVVVAPSPKSRF